MFISNLIRTIDTYDPYGVHRVNGIKVVYVLLMLFLVNFFFNIPNPYFYFFYIPITCMSAEVVGTQIWEKYYLFICAVLGSAIMVTLFDLFNRYPLFFLCFVFFGGFGLYVIIIKKHPSMLILMPIILSLAAYSLIYLSIDTNLHTIFNNLITTLIAMVVILGALVFFPLTYYYRLWLRAFYLLTKQCLDNFLSVNNEVMHDSLTMHGHTIHLLRFSQMLPRTLPTFTILKINLFIHKLHIMSCIFYASENKINADERSKIIQSLHCLLIAIEREEQCLFATDEPCSKKLISAWNSLCLRI